MTSKYDPLQKYLKAQSSESVAMTFQEIESLVGGKLPASARKHRPWWSNNPSNSVITKAWLTAGYHSGEVDMQGERLVFRRQQAGSTSPKHATAGNSYNVSFYGCMKGKITIANGYDLTKPVTLDWQQHEAS